MLSPPAASFSKVPEASNASMFRSVASCEHFAMFVLLSKMKAGLENLRSAMTGYSAYR